MTLRWLRSMENCVANRFTVPGPSSTSPATCTRRLLMITNVLLRDRGNLNCWAHFPRET